VLANDNNPLQKGGEVVIEKFLYLPSQRLSNALVDAEARRLSCILASVLGTHSNATQPYRQTGVSALAMSFVVLKPSTVGTIFTRPP
jgi:hypothetical protein